MAANETTSSAELIRGLEQHFERYAALAPNISLVLGLWSIATYIFEAFDTFPYLAIVSPTKRCGKTRVAELIEFVASNPRRTVGITAPALFRTIEQQKPTLIVDEAEALRGKDDRATSLREVLNAGYKKGQKVIRCSATNRGDYTPREFETFSPKVLVLIGTLPDTLSDRCIPVPMRRHSMQPLQRFRTARVRAETDPVRAAVRSWAQANRAAVTRWYEENDIETLRDREAELWLPLFAVCAIAAPERLPDLQRIALQSSRDKAESEPDLGVRLLEDIRSVFQSEGRDRLSTAELLSVLNSNDESPWPAWSNGKGLDARALSNMLRAFGIRPGNMRMEEGNVLKGYTRAGFEDTWNSYLPPATAATPLEEQRVTAAAESATAQCCSGSELPQMATIQAGCSAVAEGDV